MDCPVEHSNISTFEILSPGEQWISHLCTTNGLGERRNRVSAHSANEPITAGLTDISPHAPGSHCLYGAKSRGANDSEERVPLASSEYKLNSIWWPGAQD